MIIDHKGSRNDESGREKKPTRESERETAHVFVQLPT